MRSEGIAQQSKIIMHISVASSINCRPLPIVVNQMSAKYTIMTRKL